MEYLKILKRQSLAMAKEQHVGVMAQDLQKVFPNSVEKDENGYLLIKNKDEMFYAMMNAIKELDKITQELKRENNELKRRLDLLEQKLK